MNDGEHSEAITLMTRYLDGVTTASEVRTLENLLRNSAEARRVYLDLCHQAECVHEVIASDLGLQECDRKIRRTRMVRQALVAAAMITVLLSLPRFFTKPSPDRRLGSALAAPYAEFPVFASSEVQQPGDESPHIAPMPEELRMPWFVKLVRSAPQSIPSVYGAEDSRLSVVAYLLDLEDTEYCRSMRLH